MEGAPVHLTAREFDLLSFLARSPRQVFSPQPAAGTGVGLLLRVPGSGHRHGARAAAAPQVGSRPRPAAVDHHGVGRRLPVRAMTRAAAVVADGGGGDRHGAGPRCWCGHPTATSGSICWPSWGAPALVAAALVPVLRRWVSNRSSVAGTALAVGAELLAAGAVTTSAASNAMFLSSARLPPVPGGAGVVVRDRPGRRSSLTRPLAADIARVGLVADGWRAAI